MHTVAQAALHAGRNEETIRRWVREGRLAARHDGPRLLIPEDGLAALIAPRSLPLPRAWEETPLGDQPDWAARLRRTRSGAR